MISNVGVRGSEKTPIEETHAFLGVTPILEKTEKSKSAELV